MTDILTATAVDTIFRSCLFKDTETDGLTEEQVVEQLSPAIAEGITCVVGFHPGRIEEHRQKIEELLAELPDEFKKKEGGGWSFLNACNDRHGNHWGEHWAVEQLFQLGIAIGKVKCCAPREMWSALPGGVPYYAVE